MQTFEQTLDKTSKALEMALTSKRSTALKQLPVVPLPENALPEKMIDENQTGLRSTKNPA